MANQKISNSTAVLGLILNILVLPGLGSLIGGKTTAGVLQLVLFLVGIPLAFVIVGIPLMFGMWVWALITGIQMLSESKE